MSSKRRPLLRRRKLHKRRVTTHDILHTRSSLADDSSMVALRDVEAQFGWKFVAKHVEGFEDFEPGTVDVDQEVLVVYEGRVSYEAAEREWYALKGSNLI